jgi:hypothetical protein
MRSEGAALLVGLREGIRNTSHVIKYTNSKKKKLGAREHRSPPGELKPRYHSQMLQLPVSAFLRKHGHKSKKARPANCDEPGSLYNSSGTLLAVHVSRSVVFGEGVSLIQDSTPRGSRAILLRHRRVSTPSLSTRHYRCARWVPSASTGSL